MQLQKYRTWSVQKWGMPATALQSLIHHPGTCVAGPAVPQASCNLVKMGRRVSPKVFSEKKYLTGPCCSSLEQFDCSLGVFGKAQRPHDLNSKVPLFECGGQSSIFGHTQIIFIVLYCSIHHWILILSWKRVCIIPRTKWLWANPHSHQNYCIYFIHLYTHYILILSQ